MEGREPARIMRTGAGCSAITIVAQVAHNVLRLKLHRTTCRHRCLVLGWVVTPVVITCIWHLTCDNCFAYSDDVAADLTAITRRELCEIAQGISYLNCANMSPQLRRVMETHRGDRVSG